MGVGNPGVDDLGGVARVDALLEHGAVDSDCQGESGERLRGVGQAGPGVLAGKDLVVHRPIQLGGLLTGADRNGVGNGSGGVQADEGELTEDEPDLAGGAVLLQQRGRVLVGVAAAERAGVVAVLDEGDGGVGAAAVGVALLGEADLQPCGSG